MIDQVKLFPDKYSKFHFGCGKNKISEAFQSDKLFSAIVNNASIISTSEMLNKLIRSFKSGEIKLSDLVIGIKTKDGKVINFFPRPSSVEFTKNIDSSRMEGKKELRSVKYFSEGIIKELKYNEEKCCLEINYLKCKIYRNIVITNDEEKKIDDKSLKELKENNIFIFDSLPRVVVDRNNLASRNLFFEDYMTFNNFSSLELYYLFYVYIDNKLNEDEIIKLLYKSIDLIRNEGLGGKRSRGYGLFRDVSIVKVEQKTVLSEIFNEREKNISMGISTFVPNERKVLEKLLAYSISDRNGFIYSKGMTKKRKKPAFVIDSGLISREPLEGKVVNVNSNISRVKHEVYLNGKAIFINIGSDCNDKQL